MALDLCKYYKKQRFVSYNNGQTWQPLDEYERGELYEAHSSSCGAGIFQYRWVLVDGSYICDGKDRYTREVYQYSEDGTVWYNVFPTQYRKATLVERNSPFCDNAGNGQYISGDTDPTSGNTTDCPIGYFWNGTECECNGPVDGNGVCHPCANGKKWNPITQECECEPTSCNGPVDENCVCHPCAKNYTWNPTTQECECSGHLNSNGECDICVGGFVWNSLTQTCVCHGVAIRGICIPCGIDSRWNGSRCVPIEHKHIYYNLDPLKIIKCSESNGILTQNDVGYYESGWTLTSYEIGDCIYRIDDNAFNGQVYLSSITVSNTVREIGNLAFANCRNLKTLSFSNNITVFGSNVFKDCQLLENVVFGGTIPNYLPSYTFDNCVSLTNANWLPLSNITQIGHYAFRNCINLENISFPSTLYSIGKESFYGCTKIENILIPENVEFIGDSAFMACDSLTNVTINSNNIELGTQAFASCVNLTAVTFNSSAITIGNDVFGDCERLLKLTFTSPTPFEIGEGYFDNTNECAIFVPCQSEQAYKTAWPQYADRISCNDTGVYYRWVDDPTGVYCDGTDQYTRQKQQQTTNGITWTDNGVYRPITLITHYSDECGYQGEVALTVTNVDGFTRYYEPCDSQPPQPSQNSKVFATYAYGNNEEKLCDGSATLTSGDTNMSDTTYSKETMISAIIGSCVTTIGENAFWDYSSLTSVTIPNSVTNIGRYAFYRCESMKNINIPSGVTTIGNDAFSQCSGLTSVTIPDTVTSIGEWAFESCSGLTSVIIPDSVTSIGNDAFRSCRSLTSCTIGDGVTSIGDYTFGWCSSLTSVTIGSGLTTISPYAFYNCSSLPIEGYIKYAGDIAVEATDKTQSSYIFKQGTRLIGYGIFQDCSSLSSVTIPDSVTSIDNYAFTYCTSLTNIDIPSGVTNIGYRAFNNCRVLTSITIPDSVTSISNEAFNYCSGATSLTIGSGATSIGNDAFYCCSGLTSITCNAVTPPTLGKDAFKKTNDCPIYVPAESVNTYKAATNWSTYASRIQAIPNS